MNREETKRQLASGSKVYHISFDPWEWMIGYDETSYQEEDGSFYDIELFWEERCDASFDSGWRVIA